MKEKLFSALNSAKNFIGSSYANIVTQSLNMSAGLGGFLLSISVFFGVKYKTDAEIYSATFSLPAIAIILIAEGCLESWYLQKLADEHQFIAIENLKIKYGQSYKDILKTLGMVEKNCSLNLEELIKQHQSKKSDIYKYLSSFTKSLLTLPIAASTIFVYFVIPEILKNDKGDEKLNDFIVPLAIAYALFSSIQSIINTQNAWNKKAKISESIDSFFSQIEENPRLLPRDSNLIPLFNLWRDEKINNRIHVETRTRQIRNAI